MIATETIVPSRKLKIKFSTKRIEVDNGIKCEFSQNVSQLNQNEHCDPNNKSSKPDDYNKRGPPASIDCQKEKRQKIDRKGSLHCATILKSLTSHPYSWVFSTPVDPVALNIPDYFTIISEPMDLGTIKSKLQKNIYSSIEEFKADVRLTFSNAMTYNPPHNDVHLMAKELNKIFERKWKELDKKWNSEVDEHEDSMIGIGETVMKRCKSLQSREKVLPKKSQISEHKGLQKSSSFAAREANVEVPKFSHFTCKVKKDLKKGSKNSQDGESCPSLHLVTSKRGICGDITCSCVIPSNSTHTSSELSSEGSDVRDALRPIKCTSPSERKSEPDSDGAVSSLDSEHVCSSSQLATPAADASSGEVWSTSTFSVQLSPKKALRAAMLKSRFADTILKAQQKTLLEHGDKSDPLKLQLEKERLARMQREERARIEAQIKTAEAAARMKAEEELRQQREKEREAARIAIDKIERTVDIEHNMEIVKELEILSGCTLSYKAVTGRNGYKFAMEETLDKPQLENPLERLGLFIKNDYAADEDEEVLNGGGGGGWEEGEIF